MNEIESLFSIADKYNYPRDTMIKICDEISGVAFFPGGKGMIDNSNSISDKEIMVLGQDFDCEGNFGKYEKDEKRDIRKNPTWRNLLNFLKESGIEPSNCFFTNAILGIRKGDKGTGKSPAFKNPEFIKDCREFFLYQLKVQKPKTILVLGKFTAKFLSDSSLSSELDCWAKTNSFTVVDAQNDQVKKNVRFSNDIRSNLVLLLHPSFRNVNLKKRRYKNLVGNEAEIMMVKDMMF